MECNSRALLFQTRRLKILKTAHSAEKGTSFEFIKSPESDQMFKTEKENPLNGFAILWNFISNLLEFSKMLQKTAAYIIGAFHWMKSRLKNND